MNSKQLFHEGLLYLAHSASSVDGISHVDEKRTIRRMIEHEKIPKELDLEVTQCIMVEPQKEIYRKGMSCFLQISKEERIRGLAWLYRLIEADGKVHIKEARWLLYIISSADLDLDEILDYVDKLPELEEEAKSK